MTLTPTAQLAFDTLLQKPTRGIPAWLINPMEHAVIDRLAGEPEGTYRRAPEATYVKMLVHAGCCLMDQFIPENPLTMGSRGYEAGTAHGATTGAAEVVLDGMRIDSPEDVAAHLEQFTCPRLAQAATTFDEAAREREILEGERGTERRIGPTMLKSGYGFLQFPKLAYSIYGYENYFMAFALYPEVIERHFALQADVALRNNRAALQAYREGGLAPLYRLDHDMADSRATLVDIRELDRIWFPHFARALAPLLQSEVKLIWHCDGNLMDMVPRLLEVGIRGFQGFQYEHGMDYEKICGMKTRDGDPLVIIAGVSVTRTLPQGGPDDVRQEMKWLVEKGPRTGLFLGASSSIAPGVPWANMEAFVEGLHYYQERGREGR
jgi:hypothetical protein